VKERLEKGRREADLHVGGKGARNWDVDFGTGDFSVPV